MRGFRWLPLVAVAPLTAWAQAPLPPHYLPAIESAGRGDWPAARQGLERTIELEPRFGPAYRKLGQIATSFGAASEAGAFFEGLVRSPSTASSGNLGLAWLAFDRREMNEAARLAELSVLSAPPDFPAPFLLWNRALPKRGKPEEAGEYYRRWSQREPGATLPRFALHHLRVWTGQGSPADLDQMRRLHGGQRDCVEAWLLSEYQAGERQRALAAIREVTGLAVQNGDGELAYLASYSSVQILRDLGLHREAAMAADRSMADARRYGDAGRAGTLSSQACSIRLDLGEPSAERLCRLAAEQAAATPGRGSNASDAYARLANIYQSRGNYGAALEHLETALAWAGRSGFAVVEAIRRRDLAMLLLSLGQPAQAEPLLRQALEVFRTASQWQAESQSLATLARCSAAQARPVEAKRLFEEALAVARKYGDKESEQVAWSEMALAAAASGDLQQSARALDEAIKGATASGQKPALSALLSASGHLRIRLGQWTGAEKDFHASLAAARDADRRDAEWEAQFGLGIVAEQAGSPEAALIHYQDAIEASERLRGTIPDPAWRAPFFASRQQLYHRAVGVLADARRLPEAFAMLERSRARALLDLTAEPAGSSALDARGLELADLLSAAERRLLETALSSDAPAGNRGRLRRAAEAASSDYRLHLSRIRRSSAATAMIGEGPASLAEVQSSLEPDTALLSYSIGPRRGLLFVLTRDRLGVYPAPSAAVLAGRAAELSNLLGRPPERLTAARLSRLLHQTYLDLIASAEPELRRRRRWLISADGVLQRIPFAALLERPAEPGEAAAFLVRRAAMSIVPSASAWLRLGARRNGQDETSGLASLIAAVADSGGAARAVSDLERITHTRSLRLEPLPGARREVKAIAAMYSRGNDGERVEVRLGSQATESETIRLLTQARVAHLAVHGYADLARPLASALLLAPSGSANGLLQAYEIQQLRLPQLELVVLPACETLAGQDLPGEGVQGLAGSFLLAGARAVVGSMWKIADSASVDTMTALHAGLRRKLSPSQALRAAQLAALRDPARAHPYFWAGFQAIGAAN